ncbi:MAG TPA: hypothetical protein VF005_06800, partial [Acidimicrobiales bacterium]
GSPPNASTVNFKVHQTVPNLAEVGLGTGGKPSVFNAAGNTDAVVDVEGYVAPASSPSDTSGGFNPLSPARLADTRAGSGEPDAGQTLGPGQSLTVQVAGVGGVPGPVTVVENGHTFQEALAEAAVLNVTAVDPTQPGFLTVYPTGSSQPLASNVNFVSGQVVPNRVEVPLSNPSGQVSIYNSSGHTDVVVDVSGWYASALAASGQGYNPLPPSRIADTRAGSGQLDAGQTLGSGRELPLQVAGLAGVPAMGSPQQPTAVVANVTVTDTSAPSFLTISPVEEFSATSSDLNWVAGDTRANLVVEPVGLDGRIVVFNAAGQVDVVVDVVGWYSSG